MSRTQVLTDEMWARIEPLLPPLKGSMGKTMKPHRPLVEGSIFRSRAGLAWRDLPAEFGPWQTRLETARQVQQGRHLGQGPAGVADAGGCGRADRLERVGRLDSGSGSSARRDCCEVAADDHCSHRGLYRITKIRWVAGTNRTITPSGAPGVA